MKNNNVSPERMQYLKNIKRENILVTVTQIVVLVGFIGIWEFLAQAELIDSFITSQPSRILNTFMNLQSNDLIVHIAVTAYETVVGFLLGTLLGIVIAILLWWSKFLERVSEPFLVVLNSLPKVALRTDYHFMGRCWYPRYHCDGNGNFSSGDYFRNFEWV